MQSVGAQAGEARAVGWIASLRFRRVNRDRGECPIIRPIMPITFFKSPDKFRAWLEAHHASTPELWVGFYKKSSGKPSLTWPEAVD